MGPRLHFICSVARRAALVALLGALAWATASCGSQASTPTPGAAAGKIQFDLGALNADGLYGPQNGLRSLDYEFCIPAGTRYAEEVRVIAPEVRCATGSRGRIGCTAGQALCLGSTSGTGWKFVLERLAALVYVDRIVKNDWE